MPAGSDQPSFVLSFCCVVFPLKRRDTLTFSLLQSLVVVCLNDYNHLLVVQSLLSAIFSGDDSFTKTVRTKLVSLLCSVFPSLLESTTDTEHQWSGRDTPSVRGAATHGLQQHNFPLSFGNSFLCYPIIITLITALSCIVSHNTTSSVMYMCFPSKLNSPLAPSSQ